MDSQTEDKSWFPWTTLIIIAVVFGLLCAGMALYPQLRVEWYARKLLLREGKEFEAAIKKLLSLGPRGVEVVQKYFERGDTGWGKPSDHLVARVTPQTAKLKEGSRHFDIKLEIMNLSDWERVLGKYPVIEAKPEFLNGLVPYSTTASDYKIRGYFPNGDTPEPPSNRISPGGKFLPLFSVSYKANSDSIDFKVTCGRSREAFLANKPPDGKFNAVFNIWFGDNELVAEPLKTNPVLFHLDFSD